MHEALCVYEKGEGTGGVMLPCVWGSGSQLMPLAST